MKQLESHSVKQEFYLFCIFLENRNRKIVSGSYKELDWDQGEDLFKSESIEK